MMLWTVIWKRFSKKFWAEEFHLLEDEIADSVFVQISNSLIPSNHQILKSESRVLHQSR
ncbi:hypothetical protein ACOSQ4_028143 [Xanthoceras sorbifolium]